MSSLTESPMKETALWCKDFDPSSEWFVLHSGEWVSFVLLTILILESVLRICFYNTKYFLKEQFSWAEKAFLLSSLDHFQPKNPAHPFLLNKLLIYSKWNNFREALIAISMRGRLLFSLAFYSFNCTLKSFSICKCLCLKTRTAWSYCLRFPVRHSMLISSPGKIVFEFNFSGIWKVAA